MCQALPSASVHSSEKIICKDRKSCSSASIDRVAYRVSHLVAGRTPGLDGLCVVPAAVEPALLVEVDEVDEQLLADAADEAAWMPQSGRTRTRGSDTNVTSTDEHRALQHQRTYRVSPCLRLRTEKIVFLKLSMEAAMSFCHIRIIGYCLFE